MVPPSITEDFYAVLGVTQCAASEAIVRSYKRLALKLHPDRNKRLDATQAFQLVSQGLYLALNVANANKKLHKAYEALKDQESRRAYDLIYPTIQKQQTSTENKQSPQPSPSSHSQAEALGEAAHTRALQNSIQEREERWRLKKKAFDASISNIENQILQLVQGIRSLDSISAAEAAEEAKKSSWRTWILSPIYKQKVDTVEEKAYKDIERQERRMESDMKERRLALKKADLQNEESRLQRAKQEADAAILVDKQKIRVIEERIKARDLRARQERERAEQERRAEVLRRQREEEQKRWNEAYTARRAAESERQAQEQAAQRKLQEQIKRQQKLYEDHHKRSHFGETFPSIPSSYGSSCTHRGWWDKVHGRTACPECQDIWNYLLMCPTCPKQACPKCQSVIQGRKPRGTARLPRRHPPRARTPSPDYYDSYF